MWLRSIMLALGLLCMTGCDTYRTSVPVFSATPRTTLKLEEPVLLAVFDARQNKENSQEIVSAITDGIMHTYPDTFVLTDYFRKSPNGRALLRIRVREFGARFGTQVVSTAQINTAFVNIRSRASAGWDDVISTASMSQLAVQVPISRGVWVGGAYIELQVRDQRKNRDENIILPIAAQRTKAISEAWGVAQQHLIDVIDKVLLQIADTE